MKRQRHDAILAMIGNESPHTQEAILEGLKRRGFSVTQATVSRDLRELRLAKSPAPDGGYQYAPPGRSDSPPPSARLTAVLREAVISCESAQNLVIVKTIPGLAPAACSAVDAMHGPAEGVVGTLAGDDTGLAVCTDNAAADALRNKVRQFIQR
jgi:transcriptional regulator of arginine metabolism